MPLTPPPAFGTQVQAAITAAAAPIKAGNPVTDSQLAKVWEAVAGVLNTSIGSAQVAPGGFVAPPGMSGGPVTGIGGPIT